MRENLFIKLFTGDAFDLIVKNMCRYFVKIMFLRFINLKKIKKFNFVILSKEVDKSIFFTPCLQSIFCQIVDSCSRCYKTFMEEYQKI